MEHLAVWDTVLPFKASGCSDTQLLAIYSTHWGRLIVFCISYRLCLHHSIMCCTTPWKNSLSQQTWGGFDPGMLWSLLCPNTCTRHWMSKQDQQDYWNHLILLPWKNLSSCFFVCLLFFSCFTHCFLFNFLFLLSLIHWNHLSFYTSRNGFMKMNAYTHFMISVLGLRAAFDD